MQTKICEMFGLEAPIFAFSHCRDVVVEASKAGGMGILGADTFTPEQLDEELVWIEEKIGGRPYGVNALFPMKYAEVSEFRGTDPEKLIPKEHRDFVEGLLSAHAVPHLPGDEEQEILRDRLDRGRSTPAFSNALIDVAFRYPGVRAIVSAIGTPPPELVRRAHDAGIKIGAMVGRSKHAVAQQKAGCDFVVAQGYEAAGHTGDISTMVLVPQIVDAVAPLPVVAAGGIGGGRQVAAALALGAEAVWCGSAWLLTRESETMPALRERLLAASSSDTVRTRSFTGKPARFLRSAWTDAWEAPGAPAPLERPFQHFLRAPAFARIDKAECAPLISYPVGQVVGMMNEETSVRQVFYQMLNEFSDVIDRFDAMIGR